MTTRMVARRARKTHIACGGYCPPIQYGEVYIEHTELPGADAEYANSAGHPVRLAECQDCARRYGRGHLIGDRETRKIVHKPQAPRLYICSRQCRRCGHDYLFPAYGGKRVCNNCIETYGRWERW